MERPRGLRISGPLVGKIRQVARLTGTSPEAALKSALQEQLARVMGPAPHPFRIRIALLKATKRQRRLPY